MTLSAELGLYPAMSFHFREARAEDAARIVEFQLAMAWETESLELDRATCEQGVGAIFADPSRGKYYVAESEAGVIGSLLITSEWSDWRNGAIAWIQSVYVEPQSRKQGVFRGLFVHVRDQVERDPRAQGLRLYVDRRNSAAQTVYRRLGMNGDHYSVFEWMKNF